jgi:hypothetical protein
MTADQDTENKNFLNGKIERFEGKQAIISLATGQELDWPIKNLPEGADQNTSVRILIKTSASDQQDKEELAKTIINKILKPETK